MGAYTANGWQSSATRKGADIMNRIIVIGSMTNAQKAKRALLARGLRVRLTKNDALGHGNGCVYGVELAETDLLTACGILRAIGTDYRVL